MMSAVAVFGEVGGSGLEQVGHVRLSLQLTTPTSTGRGGAEHCGGNARDFQDVYKFVGPSQQDTMDGGISRALLCERERGSSTVDPHLSNPDGTKSRPDL